MQISASGIGHPFAESSNETPFSAHCSHCWAMFCKHELMLRKIVKFGVAAKRAARSLYKVEGNWRIVEVTNEGMIDFEKHPRGSVLRPPEILKT